MRLAHPLYEDAIARGRCRDQKIVRINESRVYKS